MGEAFLVGGNTLANSNEILDLIGTTADTGGSATAGTLMAKMNKMLSNAGAVKSVQRGNAAFTGESANKTVTISRVNLSKSILILTGGYTSHDHASGLPFSGHLYSSTQLYLYCDTFSSAVEHILSWQVVEFY